MRNMGALSTSQLQEQIELLYEKWEAYFLRADAGENTNENPSESMIMSTNVSEQYRCSQGLTCKKENRDRLSATAIKILDGRYPKGDTIRLVLDNLKVHKA